MTTKNAWNRELARLIAAQVCVHAVMTGTRMAAPLAALDQGGTKAEIGAMVALVALAQMVVVMPAGRFAERNGLKRTVVWSIAAAICAGALAASFPIYPVFCAAALLSGGAAGSSTIAFQRHASRIAHSPAQLRTVFAWLTIAPAVGNFFGPFAAGLMIDLAGYRSAFVGLALLPLVTGLLVRSVRDLPPRAGPDAVQGSAWSLWREPAFRRLILMNWFVSAAWDTHGFIVPILGHERGLQASAIGSILGGFALSAALVRMATPVIGAHVREWMMVSAATAIAAVLFWIYPLMASALAMGLCSAGIGIALGSVQPTVMNLLHHTSAPERRGDALAMRLVVVNGSNIAMPVLFGALSGALGIAGIFWTIGCVVGLGCPLGLRLRSMTDPR